VRAGTKDGKETNQLVSLLSIWLFHIHHLLQSNDSNISFHRNCLAPHTRWCIVHVWPRKSHDSSVYWS